MKPIFTVLITFITLPIFGQALLLNRGQSGFNLGVSYQSLGDFTSLNGGVGYSPNGALNIGLSFGKGSIDGIDNYGEFSIAPSIEYYFLKEDEETPLSVGVGLAYQRTTDTGSLLDDIGLSLTGNSFIGGISIAKNINAGNNLRIIPYIGASYISTKATISNGVDKETTTTSSYPVSIGFIFAISTKNNYFNITPRIQLTKEDTGFGLSFSFNINS